MLICTVSYGQSGAHAWTRVLGGMRTCASCAFTLSLLLLSAERPHLGGAEDPELLAPDTNLEATVCAVELTLQSNDNNFSRIILSRGI